MVLLKLGVIKIYFMNNLKILEAGGGDEIFQYFTKEIDYQKIIMFLLLFPLSAFIEELIYRSILLSFFIYYFNLNIFIGITVISVIFGFVHYTASKNWGHVFSTLISSVIYFFALIQLGLLFAWMFHLITNLFVILFYYQARRKTNKKNDNMM
ncbi:MAG: type II CAAX prenyl endopeptidase Rce1 family protein [Promethearchaeota archaeon]